MNHTGQAARWSTSRAVFFVKKRRKKLRACSPMKTGIDLLTEGQDLLDGITRADMTFRLADEIVGHQAAELLLRLVGGRSGAHMWKDLQHVDLDGRRAREIESVIDGPVGRRRKIGGNHHLDPLARCRMQTEALHRLSPFLDCEDGAGRALGRGGCGSDSLRYGLQTSCAPLAPQPSVASKHCPPTITRVVTLGSSRPERSMPSPAICTVVFFFPRRT
jgi:hypothetical protein